MLNFFKKIFGSKNKEELEKEIEQNQIEREEVYENIEKAPSKIGATIEDIKQSNKMLEDAFDGLEGALDNLDSKVDILVEMAKRGEL